MLPSSVAAFFSNGAGKSMLSTIGIILGVITLLKFFIVVIGPNEGGYRHRGDRLLESRRFIMLSWSGVMYATLEPFPRYYGKGVYLQVPFFYSMKKTNIADETRSFSPANVDVASLNQQLTFDSAVTYRVKPTALSMFRANERSITLDATVCEIITDAMHEALRSSKKSDFRQGAKISSIITKRVRAATRAELDAYGVELVRTHIKPSRSFADMMRGVTIPAAAVVADEHGTPRPDLGLVS